MKIQTIAWTTEFARAIDDERLDDHTLLELMRAILQKHSGHDHYLAQGLFKAVVNKRAHLYNEALSLIVINLEDPPIPY